jgi:transposase InsO family protein
VTPIVRPLLQTLRNQPITARNRVLRSTESVHSLANAQVVIETWRREYNDERPKKGLGGLTPAAFALRLTAQTKTAKVTAGL